jgi:hypothetical protein
MTSTHDSPRDARNLEVRALVPQGAETLVFESPENFEDWEFADARVEYVVATDVAVLRLLAPIGRGINEQRYWGIAVGDAGTLSLRHRGSRSPAIVLAPGAWRHYAPLGTTYVEADYSAEMSVA